jgi:hypothetical protein
MASPTTALVDDASLVAGILRRIVDDLAPVLGREIELGPREVERASTRPAGEGTIHISFKLAFGRGGEERHGALLVPLADALTMGSLLLMMPEDAIATRRSETTLDADLEGALLEIGSTLGESTSAALVELGATSWHALSRGCQGVRAGVRPAFPYAEGSALVVGRCEARIEPFPPFDALLILPPLS